jgi:hypothetical protein
MAKGTLSLHDLQQLNNTSIITYGEGQAFEAIYDHIQVHNQVVDELLAIYVERGTDRIIGYTGENDTVEFQALDEYGVPLAQKVAATPTNLGFPMRRRGIGLQWTRDWFLWHTPAELAAQVAARTSADIRAIIKDIKTAVFTPTNSTFIDALVDRASLPVKALVNADGMYIPPGPNGESFDGSTHTHYLARAGGSLAASDVSALIDTVNEHYQTGNVLLYINSAQEAAIRAMTSNFVGYVDPRIRQPTTATYADGRTLDVYNSSNRAIGIFDEAEVWVKPWVPASYMYCWIQGGPKPLFLREPERGERGLRLIVNDEKYPLRAQAFARDYGIGVRNRLNGAVLYTGGTSFVTPTFTV